MCIRDRGSKVDATCLILTCGVSPFDTVLEAKSVLEAVQANLIGAILTGAPSSSGKG